MRRAVPCLFLALLLALPCLASGDGALLPGDGFAPGWARDGTPRVYEGEALYDHIDGGGEAFLELGFEACTVQRYRNGREEFVFEVYRMSDAAAALGVYLEQCGRETPDPAFAERHTVGRNQLLLVKGRYYLVATSPEASPGLPSVLVAAARAVASAIPASAPPAVLDLLPRAGLAPGSLRILRGPIGLQALSTLGDGDVLLLGPSVTAVAGDYAQRDGSVQTLLVAEYPSAEQASAALRNLTEKLDPHLTPLVADARKLVFKDWKGRYGSALVEGRRLTLRLGLVAAPSL